MHLGFQAIPKNLMHRIRNRYKLQCNKNSRLCPGLAFTGGSEVSESTSSELWFGASVDLLVTFTRSSGTSSVDSGEIS
jgi:hypothetical protein